MRRGNRGRRLGGAAVCACALALSILALGCGGSDPSGSAATAAAKDTSSGPTEAILQPVGNSGVSGKVVYVKPSSGLPLMKIRLQGVRKAVGEAQYFIWQLASRHDMTSFASYHVPRGTSLSVNLEPNPESLAWLEDGSKTKMLITRIENDDRFFAAEERAGSPGDPPMIGTPVARGAFTGPLVGPAGSG